MTYLYSKLLNIRSSMRGPEIAIARNLNPADEDLGIGAETSRRSEIFTKDREITAIVILAAVIRARQKICKYDHWPVHRESTYSGKQQNQREGNCEWANH